MVFCGNWSMLRVGGDVEVEVVVGVRLYRV